MRSFTLKHANVELYFGPNSIRNLSNHLNDYKKVAVVTGKTSAKKSGALNDVEKILNEHNVEFKVYDEITPNPWASQADKLAHFIWNEGCDAVIAIGGGSVIDTAKVASVMAASGGRSLDYLYEKMKPRSHVPFIAVNLTHGTGTEIDRYSVLTVDENREKRGMSILYPDVSFDDPKYTLTLPRNQTVYTSLDTFYHSYEATTSTLTSPYVKLLSIESISLVNIWLPKALDDLNNLEARYWLLYASMIAGISIDTSSTHIIHAIEHALSGLNPKLAHGCGLGILGPRSVYYTHKTMPEESAMALKPLDPNIKPSPDDAGKAEDVVRKFQEEIGFTDKLSDYGFEEKDVPKVLEMVFNGLRYLHKNTPFKVDENIVRDIFLKSL